MAQDEHDQYDDPSLKGISRYFNGKTLRGRANVENQKVRGLLYSQGSIYPTRRCYPSSKGDPPPFDFLPAIVQKLDEGGRLQTGTVAIATYASVALVIAYFVYKPKFAEKAKSKQCK